MRIQNGWKYAVVVMLNSVMWVATIVLGVKHALLLLSFWLVVSAVSIFFLHSIMQDIDRMRWHQPIKGPRE